MAMIPGRFSDELKHFSYRLGIHPLELQLLPPEMLQDAMREYERSGGNPAVRHYLLERIERAKQFQEERRSKEEKMREATAMMNAAGGAMTASEIQRRMKEYMGTHFPTAHSTNAVKAMEKMVAEMEQAQREAEAVKNLPAAPVQKVVGAQTTEKGPIKISYTNDVEHDSCIVTLRLPYNFVAESTMPQEEKALFEQLMRSSKISDQLLGLEALVRYEENRIADAKGKANAENSES